MIGYLKGKVLEQADPTSGLCLIGVGTAGAVVGYEVRMPHSADYLEWVRGHDVEVYIYTHVREDALDLYGFASHNEKALFLSLLGISGVGPKMALGFLSGLSQGELVRAIMDGDIALLTKIPGVGKKTAERVVLELADKLKKKVESGTLQAPQHKRGVRVALVAGSPNALVRDAQDALVGLGYRDHEVQTLLQSIVMAELPPTRVEDVIKQALSQLRSV